MCLCFNSHNTQEKFIQALKNDQKHVKHKSDFYFTFEVRLRRKSFFLTCAAYDKHK